MARGRSDGRRWRRWSCPFVDACCSPAWGGQPRQGYASWLFAGPAARVPVMRTWKQFRCLQDAPKCWYAQRLIHCHESWLLATCDAWSAGVRAMLTQQGQACPRPCPVPTQQGQACPRRRLFAPHHFTSGCLDTWAPLRKPAHTPVALSSLLCIKWPGPRRRGGCLMRAA